MQSKALRRSGRDGTAARHGALAELAKRQHGVVSFEQLLGPLGYSRSEVARASESARLHRLHRGVYAVGHTNLSLHGKCLAAVFGAGPEALLSHRSAAWLWGIGRWSPLPASVTGPSPRGHRSSIKMHRSEILTDEDRDVVEGIPVTAVPRAALDLAAEVRPHQLMGVLRRSEELELFDLRRFEALLRRAGGHRGAKPLARAGCRVDPCHRAPARSRTETGARKRHPFARPATSAAPDPRGRLCAVEVVVAIRDEPLRRSGAGGWSARHRVRGAQLADFGRLVRPVGVAAEDEHADAALAGPDLALGAGRDAGDVVAVEREALAFDLDLAAAAQGDEDLLLAVLGVVVFGIALVVRRHVDDLHAEGLDPELGARPLEGAAEDGLHLVDPLDRVVAHPASFRFGGPGWAG